VLVHGTFADMTVSWNLISPRLVRAGYCVFALDLPRRAAAPIQQSAGKVSDFIARVRRATDSRRVSIVGHSQGGMLPRYYIKRLEGKGKVRDLIGLSPSNHGTTTPLAPPAGQLFNCQACTQQVRGSKFLTNLNRGDETPGKRIDYTVVQTRYDEVVTPYQSAFLADGGRRQITNVLLQDRCPTTRRSTCGSSTTRSRSSGSRTRSPAGARRTGASSRTADAALRRPRRRPPRLSRGSERSRSPSDPGGRAPRRRRSATSGRRTRSGRPRGTCSSRTGR
jgi:pimeloyl-ACP methyl ester carboxylesterase